MAVMYVWSENNDSWGHVSLKLSDDVGDIYISWWPKDDKSKSGLKKKKAITKKELPTDYNDEVENYTGRVCTAQYDISRKVINKRRIRDWWNAARKEGNYHFFFKNCCDVVVTALRKGGIEMKTCIVRTPAVMDIEGRILAGVPLPPEPEWTPEIEYEFYLMHLPN